MVMLKVKRLPKEENSKDYDEFLVSMPNVTNVGEAADTVTAIQNARLRLKWMATACQDLAKDSVAEDQRHVLVGPAQEGERYLALERCTVNKLTSSLEDLTKLCETLTGAVMMLFPEQCSGLDCQQRLVAVVDGDDAGELERAVAHRILSVIDEKASTEDTLTGAATMWWCNKPLARDTDFVKAVGKNEKTTMVVKLTKDGSSAPSREPAINAEQQSEMMAYWYKKQEEHKKLVDDDDITHTNNEWADPSGLKNNLQGMGGVQYKPGRM
jgi:hypothetical protein